MADTSTSLEPGTTPTPSTTPLSVVVEDVHVRYRVYEDRRPRLREVVTSRFRRPSFREIHAVRGVSFQAHEGEAIGVIGRNGCGKSTLLQAVAGLLPATSGRVFAKSQPSLLGVSAAMRPTVSGRRNIVLGGLALGLSREAVEAQIPGIIEFTGLDDFIDLPLRTYSSGMRARLHFAIATAVQPDILLVDEALATGDEQFKERSKERIEELIAGAGTVFLVSHSLGIVAKTCPRSLWLETGELMQDGPTEEVIDAYREHMGQRREERDRRRRRESRNDDD